MPSKGMLALIECQCSREEEAPAEAEAGEFWHSVSGLPLNAEWAKEARREEMQEFGKHQFNVKMPVSECLQKSRGTYTWNCRRKTRTTEHVRD